MKLILISALVLISIQASATTYDATSSDTAIYAYGVATGNPTITMMGEAKVLEDTANNSK